MKKEKELGENKEESKKGRKEENANIECVAKVSQGGARGQRGNYWRQCGTSLQGRCLNYVFITNLHFHSSLAALTIHTFSLKICPRCPPLWGGRMSPGGGEGNWSEPVTHSLTHSLTHSISH